ncbi:2-oxoacid dehydrogenase E1 component beta subunit (plasmid) [Natrialba magadii ATCC 43099]|uniref:2-oxoacid dehydrogenase E1 component beta subunit n=1 Tax=Natrialba magadii (strain ATCC 43099 / DSM 3394 / CCM 3739 / CIP 104546 / IAM 13178 / JCM 8861 / NBRC 102185 / NCIMB 2190 / MS3) TaxID=547559 RepID=D3T1V0_NATMM|nr:alpha-ketoacid dehydrogenase subunit beta [Natrialba magadii]ADD07559.1 2-oxoacid dehydrogenase E1 component beta subunit [Natrialba magadii ATCC 43099]ELY27200.1 transketolase [Natrialba magadii ATCC 43099]
MAQQESTQTVDRELTMSRAMVEAIADEMRTNEEVFYMGEDVADYGGIFDSTQGLLDEFGHDRIMDVPISETAYLGAAVGAAQAGMRPIAELMFVDFFGVAMDQIYNQMAKNTYMSGANVTVPMVLTAAVGGTYNDAAQHSQTLYGTFAHLPGMKVVVPSTAYDAKGLMHNAIRDDDPVVYMFHKRLMGIGWMPAPDGPKTPVPEEAYTIPFGSADVKREGADVTVVTLGLHVHRALEAAETLAEDDIDTEVIDLRTLVPVDTDTILESVEKTGRLVVVDEDYRSYGVTSEIIARVAEADLASLEAVDRLAVPDVPIPYARPLENEVIPATDDIEDTVRAITS